MQVALLFLLSSLILANAANPPIWAKLLTGPMKRNANGLLVHDDTHYKTILGKYLANDEAVTNVEYLLDFFYYLMDSANYIEKVGNGVANLPKIAKLIEILKSLIEVAFENNRNEGVDGEMLNNDDYQQLQEAFNILQQLAILLENLLGLDGTSKSNGILGQNFQDNLVVTVITYMKEISTNIRKAHYPKDIYGQVRGLTKDKDKKTSGSSGKKTQTNTKVKVPTVIKFGRRKTDTGTRRRRSLNNVINSIDKEGFGVLFRPDNLFNIWHNGKTYMENRIHGLAGNTEGTVIKGLTNIEKLIIKITVKGFCSRPDVKCIANTDTITNQIMNAFPTNSYADIQKTAAEYLIKLHKKKNETQTSTRNKRSLDKKNWKVDAHFIATLTKFLCDRPEIVCLSDPDIWRLPKHIVDEMLSGRESYRREMERKVMTRKLVGALVEKMCSSKPKIQCNVSVDKLKAEVIKVALEDTNLLERNVVNGAQKDDYLLDAIAITICQRHDVTCTHNAIPT